MLANHLFLTGYRGCGKSVVGQQLATSLCRKFIDTDMAIESFSGKTIAEIFAEVGQEGFRNLEAEQIEKLALLSESAVISLGGGAILRPENRKWICSLGSTVWLQAQPETIHRRIANDLTTQARRPKLSTLGDLEEIRTILEQRIPLYHEVADLVVSTDDRTMNDVASLIENWYRNPQRSAST